MVSLRGSPLRHPELLDPMAVALAHRGPDAKGTVTATGAALGCQRLRIVDLSERADQPFVHPHRPLWLVCNGEIYNAPELRRRYRDYPFSSESDAEVILPLFAERGAAGLEELDGMFALAVWDDRAGSLTLARDRAGEKPLFVARPGGELWFASEIQALRLAPTSSDELDSEALRDYFALGYVLEPRTIFASVRKLEAGTVTTFSAAGEARHRYWEVPHWSAPAIDSADPGERLIELLRESVRRQTRGDVPLGLYLSGGIDSALLCRLTVDELAVDRLTTFVARFTEDSFDESEWSGRLARLLGTRHIVVEVDETALSEALDEVVQRMADPLSDPAVLPTWLLGRQAREHVKVVLTGEGADELFGGYPTYPGHRLAGALRRLPFTVAALRALLRRLPASRRNLTVGSLARRFAEHAGKPWLERHRSWFATGSAGHVALLDGFDPEPFEAFDRGDREQPGLAALLRLDYATYLRDDLLTKLDRATMLWSVEPRAPYLDHALTSFAWSLPERRLVRGFTTKWQLKQAALGLLPQRFVKRRKRGLSVPIAAWIDRGLRPEVERLLCPERLRRQELVDPCGVQRMLDEQRRGVADHARSLWTVIYLQRWLETWCPDRARSR